MTTIHQRHRRTWQYHSIALCDNNLNCSVMSCLFIFCLFFVYTVVHKNVEVKLCILFIIKIFTHTYIHKYLLTCIVWQVWWHHVVGNEWLHIQVKGGTAAAAPPPFTWQPCPLWERPQVNSYYCRLGDLLCFVFICLLIVFFCHLCTFCVPSVLWYCWLGLLTCKSRLPDNLYCVGVDVISCSINQSTC